MANPITSQSTSVPFDGSDVYFDGNVYWALVDNPQSREDFERELAEMEKQWKEATDAK